MDMTCNINLVVSEILETEKSYVNHLKDIVVVSFNNFISIFPLF